MSFSERIFRLACSIAVGGAVLGSLASHGADCTRTSVGLVPLTDLGPGLYEGFEGGLYSGGSNVPPPAHASAALARARAIEPLDAAGKPDANGRYALISIGMSNTSMEFADGFMPIAAGAAGKDPALVIVDGAQGGQTADLIVDADATFWTTLETRLASAGLTPQQVVVAWVKQVNGAGGWPRERYRSDLQADLEEIARLLLAKYPNIRIAYFSSRIYGGYASTSLHPEPYAYETGLVVKWVIDKQIEGDGSLNYDASRGAVRAPLLIWGPYLWADGLAPRSDGLTWACSDMFEDGTHPSGQGEDKVGALLHAFFRSDTSARQWYLAEPGAADLVPPAPPRSLTIE